MGLFGTRLVAATPGGPVQDVRDGRWRLPDEGEEQPPHLGYRQRQQVQQLDGYEALVRAACCARCFLLVRPPCRAW